MRMVNGIVRVERANVARRSMADILIKKIIAFALLLNVLHVNVCVGSKKENLLLLNDFNHIKKPLDIEFFLNEPGNFTIDFMSWTQRTSSLGYEFYNAWQTIVEGVSARAVDTTCFKQITALVAGFAMNDLASYKYFDSWGKIPTGLLKGHLTDLGNYDECVELRKLLADQTQIQGKYCFAKLPFGKLLTAAPLGDAINVDIGVCMPAACSAKEFDVFFKLLMRQLLGINLGINRNIIAEESCSVNDKEPFDTWDWVAIAVFSILGGAMLFSSLYEFLSKMLHTTPRTLLCAFSVFSNLGQLLRVQPNVKNPNIIPCLNGIRCLSIIWVVIGHTFSMYVVLPNINALDIIPWSESAFSMVFQYAIFSVDTFFFLSGLLVAFIGLRELDRGHGKLNVPMMYVHRILRLTPMLALAVLFYATMYRHLGSGPIWPMAKQWNDLCRDTWWSTLLYVQNYVNVDRMCVGHSWYLAVDMQLYILSPIFLIALWRYRGKGVAFVSIIALLFAACVFSSIMVNDYVYHQKGVYLIEIQAMRKTYFASHARTASWFVGFLFGYFMHLTKNSRVKISKLLVLCGWLICFGLIVTVLFSFYGTTHNHRDTKTIEEAFYWTLARFAWPLALAWIVFACVNDYGGPINGFLSNPIWQPFARISYCIYIWHIIFVEFHVGRNRVNTYLSNYDVMLRFWGDFGWTLMLSVLMYLAFEAPLLNLEKLLLPKGPKSKETQRTADKISERVEGTVEDKISERVDEKTQENDEDSGNENSAASADTTNIADTAKELTVAA